MRRLMLPVAAILSTAACSSAVHAAPEPTVRMPSQTAPAPGQSSAAAAPLPAHVTLSATAQQLPPGPFRITAIACGPYTAAQQSQFGTTAKGGLVFTYANVSTSVTDAPNLNVNFLKGGTVLGDNVPANLPQVGPGQSAEAIVNALDKSGAPLSFTDCQLMGYSLGRAAGTPYAP